jgi:hypothetical protein
MLLYFCVVNAPFDHTQNHRAKTSPNTSLETRIFIPKAYSISAERIPGALAFLQYVDTLGPGFLDGTFD